MIYRAQPSPTKAHAAGLTRSTSLVTAIQTCPRRSFRVALLHFLTRPGTDASGDRLLAWSRALASLSVAGGATLAFNLRPLRRYLVIRGSMPFLISCSLSLWSIGVDRLIFACVIGQALEGKVALD